MSRRVVLLGPESSRTTRSNRRSLRLSRRLRIALVEEDKATLRKTAKLLYRCKRIEISASFTDIEAALAELLANPPDLVLMGLHFLKLSGAECIRRLKARWPAIKIVVLTKFADDTDLIPALMAGANGCLLRALTGVDLEAKIREASNGGAPLSGRIAVRILRHFQQIGSHQARLTALSPRERATLELLGQGRSYKEIAQQLKISAETQNGYIKSLYQKLRVHSALEAVRQWKLD